MLLPTADDTERQLQVRLEQVERQLRQGVPAAAASSAPVPSAPVPSAPVASAPVDATTPPAVDTAVASSAVGEVAPAAALPRVAEPAVEPSAPIVDPPVSAPPAASGGAVTTIDDVRRMWPQVVEAVKGRKRSAWIQLNRPGAGVVSVSGDRLALGLPDAGTVKGFNSGGYGDVVKLAVMDVMGVDLQIDVIAQSAPATSAAPASPPGSPAAAAERPAKPSGAERVAAAKAAPASEAPNDDDIEHGALAQDSDDDALSGEALLAQALDARQIGEIQH
jgi:DNA polymerase-3 subunit gamma/tau